MKKSFDFNISYTANGQQFTADRLKSDHFEIVLTEKEEVLKATLYPKCDISNIKIAMTCTHLYTPESKIFVNGYQSWTDTKEFTVKENLKNIYKVPRFLVNKFAFFALYVPIKIDFFPLT